MKLNKIAQILNITLLILAVICTFSIFSGPISSADFWWHLKSGQYIWETKALPSTDPFAYTTEWDAADPPSERNKIFTLRQSWLGQVFMFGVYRLFSFEGIIYMRAALLTILMMLLYRGTRREGTGLHTSLLLVLPAVIIFSGFTPERPQLFSFLFFTMMVYLLESFRKIETHSLNQSQSVSGFLNLFPLPLILLLWSNTHGGFFLGIILLFSYFVAELIKYVSKKLLTRQQKIASRHPRLSGIGRRNKLNSKKDSGQAGMTELGHLLAKGIGTPLPLKPLKVLGAITIISSLAALINPNGYSVFIVLMERRHGLYRYLISETVSSIEHVRLGLFGPELITFFLLLVLCLILLVIHIRRTDLTDAVTIILFGGLGIYLFRLIPFFTPLAVLFIARYGVRFAERFRTSRNDNHTKGRFIVSESGSGSASTQIALSSLFSLFLIFTLVKGNLFGGMITTNLFHRDAAIVGGKYPEKAVKFLKDSGIPGNMFNPLDWGGYLMWELYPEYRVFIDGRGLREDVVVQASKIMAALKHERGTMPEWKAYLEHYDVSMIVTYSVEHFTGRLIPLIPALLNDHQWNLLYADDISLIFAKETPENTDIIRKFQVPKEWVWREVVSEAQIKSRGFFSKMVRVNFLITTGDAYLSLRNYQGAMDVYAQAWQIDPNNQMVLARLQFLNSIFR